MQWLSRQTCLTGAAVWNTIVMVWLWVNLHYGDTDAVPQSYQFLAFYCESDDSRAEKSNKILIKCILKKEKWKKILSADCICSFCILQPSTWLWKTLMLFFWIFQIYSFDVSTCFSFICLFFKRILTYPGLANPRLQDPSYRTIQQILK